MHLTYEMVNIEYFDTAIYFQFRLIFKLKMRLFYKSKDFLHLIVFAKQDWRPKLSICLNLSYALLRHSVT